MKAPALLVAVSLPLLLGSCGLVQSAIQLPAGLIKSTVRTVSDASDTTTPATRDAENVAAIALKE